MEVPNKFTYIFIELLHTFQIGITSINHVIKFTYACKLNPKKKIVMKKMFLIFFKNAKFFLKDERKMMSS